MSSAVAQWKIYRTRAELAGDEGTHDLAEEDWKEALKQARQLGQNSDESRRLAYTLEKLAESQFHLNKLNDATINALESLAIYESLKEETGEDQGRLNANLAKLYHARDMADKAQEYYTRAISLKEKLLGAEHPEVAALKESFASLQKDPSFAPPAAETETIQTAPEQAEVQEPPQKNLDIQNALDSIFSGESETTAPAPAPAPAPDPVPASTSPPDPVPITPAETVAIPVAEPEPEPEPAPEAESAATPAPEPAPESVATPVPESVTEPVSTAAQTPPPAPAPQAMSQDEATQLWLNLKSMADNYLASNSLGEAEKLWLEGLALLAPFGERNPNYCLTLENLGEIRLRMQDFPGSENYFLKAYHIKVAALGQNHVAVAQTVNNLARLYYQGGHFEKAELFGRQCIEMQEKLFGPEDGNLGCSVHNLATLYHMQKKFDLAEPMYKKSLEIKRKAFGPDHPETTRLLKSYADLMRNMNRLNEADELDSMADGRISGTWRAISVPNAPGSGKKMENCDICGNSLSGASRCTKCGYDTSLGVF